MDFLTDRILLLHMISSLGKLILKKGSHKVAALTRLSSRFLGHVQVYICFQLSICFHVKLDD